MTSIWGYYLLKNWRFINDFQGLGNEADDTEFWNLLGLAQVSQGLMSFVYHTCPSETTLPVDTIFMKVIPVLFVCRMHRIASNAGKTKVQASSKIALFWQLNFQRTGPDNFARWLCVSASIAIVTDLLPRFKYSKAVLTAAEMTVAPLLIHGGYMDQEPDSFAQLPKLLRVQVMVLLRNRFGTPLADKKRTGTTTATLNLTNHYYTAHIIHNPYVII